ncbi:MAG TPA: hypothetical protein ENK18_02365 [Deltaproteobacteria bacterium]|nr:hypothetical protein [Deltaproteobacteria bacterium]
MVSLLWMLACATGPQPRPDGFPPPSGTDPGTGGTKGADPGAGDRALLQALLDGEADPAEVLDAVAWSGGWPILDGDRAYVLHLADVGPWSVAGDPTGWEPVAMIDGGGFFWASLELSGDPAGDRYKLVQGADWIADPWARAYTYDDFGEISYLAPPTDRSRLERWPGVQHGGLAPRTARIYVPPGQGPWPVLYAQDGQNLFDPEAIWGGWRLQEALEARPPVLVVGIDNTLDRLEEYTHVPDDVGLGGIMGGDGDVYADLVHRTLRPHVEATYGSSGLDGLLGSSLGGLISLHIAWRHPGDYDFVASMSGTLGWGRFTLDEETMEERWLSSSPPGITVYLDSGGGPGPDGLCRDPDGDGFPEDDPDSEDNYCETRQMADALAASGFVWQQDLWHWHEAGATHSELAWADRVGIPLDIFLGL